ncbi:MAG: hypothetical protein KH230_20440 [Enterocloster asparagiformis]|nr:hypothetical protein [Enterocloster asparagiformis]
MAKITIDSLKKKINVIDEKISQAEGNIAKYKEQKAELLRQIDDMKLTEIRVLMDENGISIDDVRELIENQMNK